MALIEYRITVDENGNATVVQDVRQIGPEDRLIFSTDGKNVKPGKQVAIMHTRSSPFLTRGPLADEVFLVESELGDESPNASFKVEQSTEDKGIERITPFGKRKLFHFECGAVDTLELLKLTNEPDPDTKSRLMKENFRAWGGGGGTEGGTGGTKTPPPG